jgi:DMSO/TMAO reductase YedYZ molybdopterin-dependent catalytic subunit
MAEGSPTAVRVLAPAAVLWAVLSAPPAVPAADQPDHGAPLRLVTPLKYGYKQIKRIGRLWFGDQRPADYWAGYGYD